MSSFIPLFISVTDGNCVVGASDIRPMLFCQQCHLLFQTQEASRVSPGNGWGLDSSFAGSTVAPAERYEHGSVFISSNLPFSKWEGIFKDPMTTAAAIDRLVHHCVILELNIPSYRVEQAKKAKEEA